MIHFGIIAGGRFSKEMIRKGEDNSFVELALYLPDNAMSIDGNIIVSREINLSGKNLCKINGRLVTVTQLKDFMKDIIDIHSQFDNQTLMDKSSHTKYIDKFSGIELLNIKNEYNKIFEEYKNIKKQLLNNYGDDKEKSRKLDLLRYQLSEINNAHLNIEEEKELEEHRNIMINSQKITENLSLIDENLNNGTIETISTSIKSLEKIENINEKYSKKLIELKNVYYEVQEIARDISDYKDEIYFDEEEQNEIENRLDSIYSLKRKYGNDIQEILDYGKKVKEEIEKIENIDKENNKLKAKLEQIENNMTELANKITKIREKNCIILNKKINTELQDLEMENAKFNAVVINQKDFTENGLSNIEFLISTNIGEEFKPLNKIASGGEMSRIMLAIKTVLSDVDETKVLVFDEIDTGISGKAANMVGNKLLKVSKKHQVLIITHLAQIAAKGEHNYYIYKKLENSKTKTKIKKLNENETIEEIARIASGEITQISLTHAMELRKMNVA